MEHSAMSFITPVPFRRHQPVACATSPRSTSQTASTSIRQHPDTLSNHQLLKPHQERTLLLQIRALQTINAARDQLQASLGRQPTDKQLANELGLTPAKLKQQTHAGIRARNDLVSANLRLVVRIATQVHKRLSRQTPQNIPLEDLVQEGCIALIKAAECYNMDSGARFSTFAHTVVYNACLREGPRGSIVSIPERLRQAKRRSTWNANVSKNGKDDVPTHLLEMAEPHMKKCLTLDAKVGDKSFVEFLAGKVTSEEVVQKDMVLSEIRTACYRSLSERYADIIIMRFGLNGSAPMSGKSIAKVFGLSEPRIAQIVLAGLEKLRKFEPHLAEFIYDL